MKEKKINRAISTDYVLKPYHILRYETSEPANLVLKNGQAEIFGRELCIGQEMILGAFDRGTLNTFHGCTVTVLGDNVIAFVMAMNEDQNLPIIVLNIHANLEKRRHLANENQTRGPNVMICGLDSVGKSTLALNLINYAARKSHRPIFVDLNSSLNQISVPSTISAISVTKPCEMKDKFCCEEEPLVYCLGQLEPTDNLELYHKMVQQLSEMINIRAENDAKILSSGCIINTPGFKKDPSLPVNSQPGIELLKNSIQAFEVETVIVIEDVFLFQFLKKDLPNDVNIIRIPKSSAVVTRTQQQLNTGRDSSIAAYYHGETKRNRIYPHHLTISSVDFEIYRLGVDKISDSLLPHGSNKEEEEAEPQWRKVTKVPFGKDLKNHVLAVSQAQEAALIPDSPVHGFIVVIDVNTEKNKFTILSPNKELPPNHLLLLTPIMYVDIDN
ncbi:Cleavage polyadenylation factor subunit clp1 [Cichlidogyrus casuarinus]|uniref:Cleavage polyadenylation factor subunit clp1 n=1 Tax=Cichlidogyrus casuarinus TaxID=1844966 RepID=A0ABD2QBS5_9PLAT